MLCQITLSVLYHTRSCKLQILHNKLSSKLWGLYKSPYMWPWRAVCPCIKWTNKPKCFLNQWNHGFLADGLVISGRALQTLIVCCREDPVVLETGQSYERVQIQKWLKRNKTCPKTGIVLQSKALIPNCSLKTSIQEWNDKQSLAAVYSGFQARASI